MHPERVTPICAYVIHLIAVPSHIVPTLAPYKNQLRKFNQPSGSNNIVRAFLNYADHSQGLVQIQPFRMMSPYKYMHQPIYRLSETIHAPLIIVPFFNAQQGHDTDGGLRIFNTNIQAVTKCTNHGVEDYHDSKQNRLEAQIDREGDNTLFGDFKAMNVDNGRVTCLEVVAHDIEDVMKAFWSLSNTYDLVVVGKRHTIPELQAMLGWTQYPELGASVTTTSRWCKPTGIPPV
ncbi:hypothetical protein F3Y22_tig00112249pilonHSYRG00398 [Hibiscus syriacus]|uniref:Uncharacterized protein n=1 Tax=Hibiscus syriacus TaxID=106335 RepID=A0A6A2YCJ4_HIBSY|nr:hypothetical protein F3Y22_tig00112249pilonHSYRG00398 [Hibiscus syriacus]